LANKNESMIDTQVCLNINQIRFYDSIPKVISTALKTLNGIQLGYPFVNYQFITNSANSMEIHPPFSEVVQGKGQGNDRVGEMHGAVYLILKTNKVDFEDFRDIPRFEVEFNFTEP